MDETYPALGVPGPGEGTDRESEQLDTSNVIKLGPWIPPSFPLPRWGSLEHSPQESRITKASASLCSYQLPEIVPSPSHGSACPVTTLWGSTALNPSLQLRKLRLGVARDLPMVYTDHTAGS